MVTPDSKAEALKMECAWGPPPTEWSKPQVIPEGVAGASSPMAVFAGSGIQCKFS